MIGVPKSKDVIVASVEPCHGHCHVVGFRARVDKVAHLQEVDFALSERLVAIALRVQPELKVIEQDNQLQFEMATKDDKNDAQRAWRPSEDFSPQPAPDSLSMQRVRKQDSKYSQQATANQGWKVRKKPSMRIKRLVGSKAWRQQISTCTERPGASVKDILKDAD